MEGRSEGTVATTCSWSSEGPWESLRPVPHTAKTSPCEGAGNVVAPSSNHRLQGS